MMTKLLAFHSDMSIKAKYLTRVENHIKMDNLVRGTGWNSEDGKGCAVGCTLEAYDHSLYPIELGIPEWLAKVEDTLFESMTLDMSRTWPLVFLSAIKPGVDLERTKGLFLVVVLKSALESLDHNKFPDVKLAIDRSIALWQHSNIGSSEWMTAKAAEAEAWAAAAEAWAARAAAEAWAAEAAWAAAWAA